jgi:hypothetical protein
MDAPTAGGRTGAAPAKSGAAPARRVSAPAPPPVAAPLTGYAWDGEKSVAAFRGPFDRVVDTGVLVLRKLQFTLDTKLSRRAVDSATLAGVNPDERQVRLDIRPLSNLRVEVRVKVGVAGDRSCSERVLDEMQRQLGGPQDQGKSEKDRGKSPNGD